MSLVYTVAFDKPGDSIYRQMAWLMIYSLRGSGYTGDILAFTLRPSERYSFASLGASECIVSAQAFAASFESGSLKQRVRARQFIDGSKYSFIWFIDPDCIVAQPPVTPEDDGNVWFAMEPHGGLADQGYNAYLTDAEIDTHRRLRTFGINAGVFCVRGSAYHDVMADWDRIDSSPPLRWKHFDQPAWCRFILDNREKCRPFPVGLVRYPLWEPFAADAFGAAGVLHFCGLDAAKKLAYMVAHCVICDSARQVSSRPVVDLMYERYC